jgi:hypothetical protein
MEKLRFVWATGLTLTFEHLSDVFISLDDGLVSPTSQLLFTTPDFSVDSPRPSSCSRPRRWTSPLPGTPMPTGSSFAFLARRGEAGASARAGCVSQALVRHRDTGDGGGSNIRPLNEKLGIAYGIDRTVANERFGIGRLTSARADVVHTGARPDVPSSVMLLLNGVYVDVLYCKDGDSP